MTLFWCILHLQDIFGVQICCIRHNKNKIEKKNKKKTKTINLILNMKLTLMCSLSLQHEAAMICFSTMSAVNDNFYKESIIK